MRDNILNDVYKVELSTMNVELGAVDDFNKLSKSFFTQSGKFETTIQKIELGIKDMQKQFIETQKIVSLIDSDYQKVRKSAVELGVSIPNEIENSYKTALAVLKNDFATFNKYNK